ncbi:MAG: lipopolysaccharide transport periplasmic protein LptA [Elusimicrobia bacterium ADurb.Bin231]|nr:MAG: lipopolysaccharide transport periplasmic protein LptA [Elusimicrobia bacterium ADurb.Bin231]
MNVKRIFFTLLGLLGGIFFISDFLLSAPPLTITSDKMKIISQGEVSEFIGNVLIVQGNLTIKADVVKANDKTGLISAKNDIIVHYSSDSVSTYAWGDSAEYDKNRSTGVLIGNVRVKRHLSESATDFVTLTCDRLDIMSAGERLRGIGNARIVHPSGIAESDEVFYDNAKDEIILSGTPARIQKHDGGTSTEYYGDRIILDIKTENVTITGNVRTKIMMK